MLRGQIAIFLSCSEKFKADLGWPVRDALTSEGLCAVIMSDAPPLPGPHGGGDGGGGDGGDGACEAKAGPYLDASSAFVALCTADYELSDGSRYPKANIIDEIQQARARPHLRDRSQVLKSPGVLLPSDITPTYDGLDPARPVAAADVILAQLRQWGIVPGSAPAPHPVGTEATDDVDVLFPGLDPGDHDEARRRVYPLLRDRGETRRQGIARELHRKTLDQAAGRALVAATLLRAISGLDAALVTAGMIEVLAAHPGYPARACAAELLRDRAALAPLQVPVEVLGRLARPSAEDWLVWAPAMTAVAELAAHRPDAVAVLEALADSGDTRDRYAAAETLLAVAGTRPAVAAGLAGRLVGDPDPLIAGKAQQAVDAAAGPGAKPAAAEAGDETPDTGSQ